MVAAASPILSSESAAQPGDLLRIEHFGSLYYHRRTARFALLPPHLTRLLLDATRGNALEAYARDPKGYDVDEETLIRDIEGLLHDGMLDEGFRCHARVLHHNGSHAALTGPLITHIQLTRACNLRCTHCFVDITPKPDPHELSTAQMLSLFAELETLGSPVVVLAGGEPMLRRDFWELVAGVGRHGLDASLCTNGTLITEENAARLAASPIREYSISLDGPDAPTHDTIRGAGRFEQALRGIRLLRAAGAKDVQFRVTVTSGNADRLGDYATLGRELGVTRVAFKPFRQTETGAAQHADGLYIDRLSYLRAMERAKAAWPSDGPPAQWGDGIPTRTPEWAGIIPPFGCVGGTTSASVMYDGRVVSCGFVLDPQDWSLHAHSFTSCWREAPTIRSWRTFTGNDQCGSCENFTVCGGGCRARATGAGRTLNEPDPWADCTVDPSERPSRKRLHVIA
ncbi:MAG: radical SAM protein [Myxococcota bacterium]